MIHIIKAETQSRGIKGWADVTQNGHRIPEKKKKEKKGRKMFRLKIKNIWQGLSGRKEITKPRWRLLLNQYVECMGRGGTQAHVNSILSRWKSSSRCFILSYTPFFLLPVCLRQHLNANISVSLVFSPNFWILVWWQILNLKAFYNFPVFLLIQAVTKNVGTLYKTLNF